MTFQEFIIATFVLLDDLLKATFGTDTPWRRRGPAPTLSDSEVLTMEIVGEFLGIDTDKGLFQFFRRHALDFFPCLAQIQRTSFVRQAARLARVKYHLWQQLCACLPWDGAISVLDSFPMPVCRFARAKRCRLFRGQAAFGHDELAKQTFYGFRWHLRLGWPGVIVQLAVAPANVHDLKMVEPLLETQRAGWAVADRNYWSPEMHTHLQQQTHIQLLAPFRHASRDRTPWPRWLTHLRRRIETVIGQLVERYRAKRIWARDLWHLASRVYRKVLSHTVALCLNLQLGHDLLQLRHLLTD